ncbi:MAG: nucleotidyltransferase domain-containing protein [Bacteroidales bacterium]|nr:nucleotidyltransferase domain-containing protein [Candidatus Minthousia equi]
MVSEYVMKMIPKLQQMLTKQPIEKAWLFGSCSRGEETPTSDIDLLVEYQKDATITLFTISRIMLELKEGLNRDVDLIEDGCLLPFAVESAERDKILIYERGN